MKFTTIKIAALSLGLATLLLSNTTLASKKCENVRIYVQNDSSCGALVRKIRFIEVATNKKRVKHTPNFSVPANSSTAFGVTDLRKVLGKSIRIRVHINGGLIATHVTGDSFECEHGARETVVIPPGQPGCLQDSLQSPNLEAQM